MKLSEIQVLNLSNRPKFNAVKKLRPGDNVLYENRLWTVEFLPKREKNAVLIGVMSTTGEQRYIKIIEDKPQKMTRSEKSGWKKNVKSLNTMRFDRGEEFVIRKVKDYYDNLVELNNYDLADVREVLNEIDVDLLKRSGVVL